MVLNLLARHIAISCIIAVDPIRGQVSGSYYGGITSMPGPFIQRAKVEMSECKNYIVELIEYPVQIDAVTAVNLKVPLINSTVPKYF